MTAGAQRQSGMQLFNGGLVFINRTAMQKFLAASFMAQRFMDLKRQHIS